MQNVHPQGFSMHLKTFSNWLETVTQPNHPFYHPLQLTFFAGISYIGTGRFTKIPPAQGMRLIASAYVISQLTTPCFVQCFEPYQNVSLVPLIGQVMQMTVSLMLAKIICNLIGDPITFKEARLVSTVFFINLFASQFALFKIKQLLS